MRVNVDLDDFDIFSSLYSFDDFRVGVIAEFFRHFDENYDIWQEEEKQRDIDMIIYQINDKLSSEYKKKLVAFMERLTNKLEY